MNPLTEYLRTRSKIISISKKERNLKYIDTHTSYFEDEIKKANKNKYYISQYTELYEELFILFAKDVVSEGVKLIVISGPTHPLINLCYPEELDIAYNNFITEQASEIGFTYLPENKLPPFSAEDFIDFTHLNAQGRSKLSRFLKIYLEENNLP